MYIYQAGQRVLSAVFPLVGILPEDASIHEKRAELVQFAMQMKLSRPDRINFLPDAKVLASYRNVRHFNDKLNQAYCVTLITAFSSVALGFTGAQDFAVLPSSIAASCYEGVMSFANKIKDTLTP